MAIEIREVVVKATVHKSIGGGKTEYVTKTELLKMQDKMVAKIMGKVKNLLEEERAFR